jgi:hypothetical protein
MGYTTKFDGVLNFKSEVTVTQLAFIKAMCGEDCREHPEWGRKDLSYIDLQITEDYSGLEWSGAEKTYDMCDLVNVVTAQVRKKWPEFSLTGRLLAQGEDIDDRWMLVIGEDGLATKQEVKLTGTICTCPDCGHRFEVTK